jgi:hypothetical protein
MSWICKTLLVCLSFNPIMDYTNNDEFIDNVRACALHLNSMHAESRNELTSILAMKLT